MEVFVRGVPDHATNKDLERAFKGPLGEYGIEVFHVDKFKNRDLASVTLLDKVRGQAFLQRSTPVTCNGRALKCSKSYNAPSDYALQSLVYESSRSRNNAVSTLDAQTRGHQRCFLISDLQCGQWDYHLDALSFTTHYRRPVLGSITFGRNEAILLLGDRNTKHMRIDLKYRDCENIVTGRLNDPTLSFTLRVPPKFYEVHGEDALSVQMAALLISNAAARQKDVRKSRQLAIDNDHGKVAGIALVYRITLTDRTTLSTIRTLLSRTRNSPPTIGMPTGVRAPIESWGRSKMRLDNELIDSGRLGSKPFSMRFQLDRLARNGTLPPQTVIALLPAVSSLDEQYGTEATLAALAKLYNAIPSAGPDTEASEWSIACFTQALADFAAGYDFNAPDNVYELTKRHAHVELIHRAVVTPAGARLEGPLPEPTNRVLRKYEGQTHNFLRVVFQDEDGSSVRYDPRASQDLIYHKRFQGVLDGTFNIAGKPFSFLGFSHSSMRNQQCWFMAPMTDPNTSMPLFAPHVIKELGDFSNIRTPAKCAARIGQCFTDTAASIEIRDREVYHLPVVERNGRDFSDGVGTISEELLKEVWQVYGLRRQLKPTILQIRFQGAKGVVSLDSRLRGRKLCLRSNMEKFSGSRSRTLEICGAAFRPLPMVLNRQFIKILEDLDTPTDSFLELQKEAIEKLRCRLNNAINTAWLMEEIETTRPARLTEFILLLVEIGVDFRQDTFMYSIVEMAVMTKLREIKYRGRIPIEQGVTLYGIMDETGFLREGEIFVALESPPDGGLRTIVHKNIVVTRSPALHPGDIQLVNAVDVPENSPLRKLRNMVVFSSRGARDLPSQLSGGDLDGDLYNVFWDRRIVPRLAHTPADYPRVPPVELDRPVTTGDMSSHLVTFMENDVLGMLCNIHLQLADQLPKGTLSPECIKLAGMASTAVDYSKTGLAVNMKECPRYSRYRPDFMAPSPRVIVAGDGYLALEEDDQNDDDAFEGLDTEHRPYQYYESKKALGYLYRNIDERKFVVNMQQQHRALTGNAPNTQMLQRVLAYVMTLAGDYGVLYRHHLPLARNIRSTFEENVLDIMYRECPTAYGCLSETEVFSGSILGRQGGAQDKPLRDRSKAMRDEFGRIIEHTVHRITLGDEVMRTVTDLDELYDIPEDREMEGWARAIACLMVAVREPGWQDPCAGEMKSFGYVAARACLMELKRYRITTFGSRKMPRIDA